MLGYNKVTLYGKGAFNYVWTTDIIESQTVIDATTSATYVPTWDDDTMLLANYVNGYNGGTLTSLNGEAIENWVVYRYSETDNISIYIATIPVSQTNIVDYNVRNGKAYKYVLYASSAHYRSLPITTNSFVDAVWQGWMIADVSPSPLYDDIYIADADNLWVFDTALTSDSMVSNMDKYQIDNFTQFPKISTGEKNYISGGLTAYINNPTNGIYSDTVTMQEKFRKFLNNGNVKLLKDRKGNVMFVDTNSGETSCVDESYEQITKVQFTFIQVDSGDAYSVVEEV